MKLYIPSLGDQLRLTADWTFNLYNEYRNDTLIELAGISFPTIQSSFHQSTPYVISADSILKIDRIYIRKGADDFNSVTFMLVGEKTKSKVIERTAVSIGYGKREEFTYEQKKPARPVRFWAKLEDVNNIEFENV